MKESTILLQKDKELILGFIEHLKAKRVSTGRLVKYMFAVRRLMEHLGVPMEHAPRKDIEKLSIWIRDQGYSAHTVSDYLSPSNVSTSSSETETLILIPSSLKKSDG